MRKQPASRAASGNCSAYTRKLVRPRRAANPIGRPDAISGASLSSPRHSLVTTAAAAASRCACMREPLFTHTAGKERTCPLRRIPNCLAADEIAPVCNQIGAGQTARSSFVTTARSPVVVLAAAKLPASRQREQTRSTRRSNSAKSACLPPPLVPACWLFVCPIGTSGFAGPRLCRKQGHQQPSAGTTTINFGRGKIINHSTGARLQLGRARLMERVRSVA